MCFLETLITNIHYKHLFQRIFPFILLTPAMIVMAGILVYPSIYNLWLSLWNFKLLDRENAFFVGLDNYINIFVHDPLFWIACRNTLIFVVASVMFEFLLGMIAALLLVKKSGTTRRILSSLIILPYMISPPVVGLTWRLLWTYEYGLINYLLRILGMTPIHWLGDPSMAMISIIITEVWRNTPFIILILMAGLVSLPIEPYEAAQIDGASAWQRYKYITLPLIIPSITIALLLQTIFAIRVFGVIFTLTRGGPGTATLPLGILLYRQTFRFFQGGYAAALAMIILVIGLVVSTFYLRLLYKKRTTG
jgi:multiple sugar transport system permease protein